jgi:uncharacterized repeat protein (TIGR01451 family)
MKNIFVVILVFSALLPSVSAAQRSSSLVIKYKQCTLTFASQPQQEEAKRLPFIEGAASTGNRERFGVLFGNVPPSTTVLEILGNDGKVLKAVSINDLLGHGDSKGVSFLSEESSFTSRRAENVYRIELPQGETKLIVKAIAAGDPEQANADQQLIVTFALKSSTGVSAGLKLWLPVVGTVETAEKGLIFSSKAGTCALAAAFYPPSRTIVAEKNRIILTSPVATSDNVNEVPLLWMVMNGVASSSRSDCRAEAQRIFKENQLGQDDPRVVVVGAADRERSQPGDTASYTLVCTNVGTGDATDVVLRNPVPGGARYIEGSATTDEMVLSFERAAGDQPAEVRVLKWTLPQALRPGAEKIVRFKVIIQ